MKAVLKCLRIGFSIVSISIGGIATGLPDVHARIAFAIALGLSNAAIYIKGEESEQEHPSPQGS